MRAFAPSLIVVAVWIGTAVAQDSSTGQPYVGADAYEIYSLLIPQQESYGFAKGTLVIQQETLTNRDVAGACLSSETTRRFGGAISDYRQSQTKKWLLNRHFEIEKPYEIVNEQTLGLLRGHGIGALGRLFRPLSSVRRVHLYVCRRFQQEQDSGNRLYG